MVEEMKKNLLVSIVPDDYKEYFKDRDRAWECRSKETWKFLKEDDGSVIYDEIILENPDWCWTREDVVYNLFKQSKNIGRWDGWFINLELYPVYFYSGKWHYSLEDGSYNARENVSIEVTRPLSMIRDMEKLIELNKWSDSIGFNVEKKELEGKIYSSEGPNRCPNCEERTLYPYEALAEEIPSGALNAVWQQCESCNYRNWSANGYVGKRRPVKT